MTREYSISVCATVIHIQITQQLYIITYIAVITGYFFDFKFSANYYGNSCPKQNLDYTETCPYWEMFLLLRILMENYGITASNVETRKKIYHWKYVHFKIHRFVFICDSVIYCLTRNIYGYCKIL
jgi:hypothetical protein